VTDVPLFMGAKASDLARAAHRFFDWTRKTKSRKTQSEAIKSDSTEIRFLRLTIRTGAPLRFLKWRHRRRGAAFGVAFQLAVTVPNPDTARYEL
jgi:hypothetical protein